MYFAILAVSTAVRGREKKSQKTVTEKQLLRLVIVSCCFEPTQPHRVISGLVNARLAR